MYSHDETGEQQQVGVRQARRPARLLVQPIILVLVLPGVCSAIGVPHSEQILVSSSSDASDRLSALWRSSDNLWPSASEASK